MAALGGKWPHLINIVGVLRWQKDKLMTDSIWQDCLEELAREVEPDQFETYIKPLHSANKSGQHFLLAPNVYVERKVREAYLLQISEFFEKRGEEVNLSVGTNLAASQVRAKQPRKTGFWKRPNQAV